MDLDMETDSPLGMTDMDLKQQMVEHLGFTWEKMTFPLQPPNQERALYRLHKMFAEVVYDIVHLEGNPFTFPEVQTVLEGITVGGKRIEDEQQILHQQKSLRLMVEMVKKKEFNLEQTTFCQFNSVAAQGESLDAGKFRTGKVGIGGTKSWVPPPAEELSQRYERGIHLLNTIPNPMEKACAMFLFGARMQFFWDGNKRSSRLMMNGILLSAGQDAISIPACERARFNEQMVTFYDSGEGTEMMRFLAAQQIKSKFE
jgi:Fic family protein